MARKMLSLYAFTSGLVTFGNACAFLLQFVFVRLLTPDEYGAVNAIFGLSMTVVAPAVVLPIIITQLSAEAKGEPEGEAAVAQRIFVGALGLATLMFAIAAAAGNWLAPVFNVDTLTMKLLLPLLAASTMLSYVPIGYWQAQRRYIEMSIGIAASPIVRLICGIVFVGLMGGGSVAGLMAFVGGGLFVFVCGSWRHRHLLTRRARWPQRLNRATLLRLTVPAALSMFAVMSMTFIDLPIVRSFASPDQSGLYSAASALSKITLLLPNVLINIVFPEAIVLMDAGKTQVRERTRLIATALGFTLAVSGAATLVIWPASQLIMSIVAGAGYTEAAPLLSILSASMAFLAASTLIVSYSIARRGYIMLLPVLASLAVLLSAPHIVHLNVTEFSWTMLSVTAFTFVFGLGWLLITHLPACMRETTHEVSV